MKLIEAENISFSYPMGQGTLPVTENLNLSVEKGEFVSILGSSGCGKTTLLKLFSGFYLPDEGQILYEGKRVDKPFSSGQMIFQDTGQLLSWLTVEKNILFPRHPSILYFGKKGLSGPDLDYCEELLEITGLKEYRDFYPNQLSGGLKQRVSLARALYSRPHILFLDEPFVSLDAPSRAELQQLLLKLWKVGNLTIFFVTHDISEALILSDRILVFPGGSKKPLDLLNLMGRPRQIDNERFIKENIRLYSIIDAL